MATFTLRGGGGLDTRDFSRFAKALRKAAPQLAVDLRVELRGAGELVAAEARSRSSVFSKRIPKSVRVRASGATVSVVAGGKSAPHAAPIDNRGKAGKFRHPVFGNRDAWADQDAHPFFREAVDAGRPAAERAAVNALDRAVARVVTDT